MSKVFSLAEYNKWIQNTGNYDGGWAKYCDGQPVIDGYVRGTDGLLYISMPICEVDAPAEIAKAVSE